MSGVCYAFQRGECQRGSGCKFSHDATGAGSPPPRRSDRPSGVCYAFQRGECDRGSGCRFSHDTAGGSGGGGGDNWRSSRPSGGDSRSYGRSSNVCFQFQRGECDRGDACRFSHDTSGASAPPRGGGGDRPRGVCYSFQRGECTRGDGCRFSHEVSA